MSRGGRRSLRGALRYQVKDWERLRIERVALGSDIGDDGWADIFADVVGGGFVAVDEQFRLNELVVRGVSDGRL